MRKRILCVFVVSVLLIVTNVSTSILTTSISDAKWENTLFASINANIREFTIRGKAILSSVEENNAERYYDSRDDFLLQQGRLLQSKAGHIPPDFGDNYPRAMAILSDISVYSYGLPYSVDAFSKFQMREQFQNLLLMLETSQGSSFEITLKNIENSNYIDSLYATIAPTMN